MPKVNHKGQSRRFTSAEQLEEDRKAGVGIGGDDAPGALPVPKKAENGDPEEEEEEDEESSDDDGQKHKGVSHLIEVSNPNRVAQRSKKASEIGLDGQAPRKQKEILEVDRLRQLAERKQAEADLARLAIVRKQREEEERKLAEVKKLKEMKGMPQPSTSPSGQAAKK